MAKIAKPSVSRIFCKLKATCSLYIYVCIYRKILWWGRASLKLPNVPTEKGQGQLQRIWQREEECQEQDKHRNIVGGGTRRKGMPSTPAVWRPAWMKLVLASSNAEICPLLLITCPPCRSLLASERVGALQQLSFYFQTDCTLRTLLYETAACCAMVLQKMTDWISSETCAPRSTFPHTISGSKPAAEPACSPEAFEPDCNIYIIDPDLTLP